MDNYAEERKVLIALTAYSFSEACANKGVDGWWVSYGQKIVKFAEEYDFPIEENGTIIMDQMYHDIEVFAYSLVN